MLLTRHALESRKCYSKLKGNTLLKTLDFIRTILARFGRSSTTLFLLKNKESPACTKNLSVVANEFNQFFSKVGKNAGDASQHLSEENNITIRELSIDADTSLAPDELFNLRTVTAEEIHRAVASLPLNKSPGPDKVNACILKDCLPVILGPLTETINCSILTSTFPAS